MFCKNCGAPIADNAPFCPQCGNNLNQSTDVETQALLKRAMIFLEDEEWAKADDYCERILDIDPENAQAYLIKLMIRAQIKKEEDLANMSVSYANWHSYQTALRFSNEEQQEKLIAYLHATEESIRNKELEEIRKQQEQVRKEEEERKWKIYRDACYYERTNATISDLILATDLFKKIPHYKDSAARADSCSQRLQKLQAEKRKQSIEQARARQRSKRRKIVFSIIIAIALAAAIALLVNVVNNANEEKAKKIHSNLAGTSFAGSYTEYQTGSSEDQFKPITSMSKYDVTYTFKSDGSVEIKTITHEGGGTYYTDKNGDRIWDRTHRSYEMISNYKVDISFWGEITVTIGEETFELKVDSFNHPISLTRDNVTYYEN